MIGSRKFVTSTRIIKKSPQEENVFGGFDLARMGGDYFTSEILKNLIIKIYLWLITSQKNVVNN